MSGKQFGQNPIGGPPAYYQGGSDDCELEHPPRHPQPSGKAADRPESGGPSGVDSSADPAGGKPCTICAAAAAAGKCGNGSAAPLPAVPGRGPTRLPSPAEKRTGNGRRRHNVGDGHVHRQRFGQHGLESIESAAAIDAPFQREMPSLESPTSRSNCRLTTLDVPATTA